MALGRSVDPRGPSDSLAGTNAVIAEHVTKRFSSGSSSVTALQDVSLTVGAREFVSLIGPSGCGKSTLLQVIGDLVQPSSGTVLVGGKDSVSARRSRSYGIVFQTPTLFDWRTVLRNVELPLELEGVGRSERRRRARDMLRLVDLEEFENHRPFQLSGGMQQRVSIARALATEPGILLMDEPFGALDEITRERLNLELLRIWDVTNSSVVFVTHSIPEAVFLSTKVVVMTPRPGRIAKVVPIGLDHPRGEETQRDQKYFELIAEVRDALHSAMADAMTDGS